jgi:hypothetical protein
MDSGLSPTGARALTTRAFQYAPAEKRRPGVTPVGFRLDVPEGVVIEPSDPKIIQLRATERRAASGRPLGELEIRVFAARLIMDRDGVMLDAARAAAEELFAPPRDGWLGAVGAMTLPAGEAWRAEVRVTRDEHGRLPPLPYKTVYALAHPNAVVHAALLIVVAHAEADWPAGQAMLASLSFL